MELSTTTRGKAKPFWNGYTKHTEKNYIFVIALTGAAKAILPSVDMCKFF